MEFKAKHRKLYEIGTVLFGLSLILHLISLALTVLGVIFMMDMDEEIAIVAFLIAFFFGCGGAALTVIGCILRGKYKSVKKQYLSAMLGWVRTGQLAPGNASALLANEDQMCSKQGRFIKKLGIIFTIVAGVGMFLSIVAIILIAVLSEGISIFSGAFGLVVVAIVAVFFNGCIILAAIPCGIFYIVTGTIKQKETFRLGA